VRRPTRTSLTAAALLIVALAVRVADVQATSYRPINDAGSYLTLASEIARTGDYSTSAQPGSGAGGTRGPSAYFPPAFPYFLAAVEEIGGNTTRRGGAVHPARLSQAALGTVTVGLVGLVAFELFDGAVALIALGLAAVYPVLVELSAVLVAENLMTALILAVTWTALRARRSAHPYRWIAASGVLTGLATLTHVNSAIVILPLGFAAWRARRHALAPVTVVAAAVLTITPWLVRDAIDLHRFIPVTDETGITLRGTYNPASAAYAPVPYKWRIFYGIPGERALVRQESRLTEPELSSRLERQALDYIGAHPLSPLEVAYHNSVRLLELEGEFAWRASAYAQGIPLGLADTGVICFWIVCLLAIAGAFTRRIRVAPAWIWAIPVLLWFSSALINAETPRFREPVDPFLILSAACALAAAPHAAQRAARALQGAPVRRERGPVLPGRAGEPVELVQRLA
jgi:4-amino-4-deoxy-L-arabinose transferase-like glycosyltransferase